MSHPFLSALTTAHFCCDGAMGTQLLARGLKGGDCGMLWNLDRSAEVLAIHQAYRSAGADLITTNSFGGSSSMLNRHGLADRVRELNRAAAQIAKAATGEGGWVLGDVGPFGDFLEPLGETTSGQLRDIFRVQIEALLEGGADAILLETMSSPAEVMIGIESVKHANPGTPIIVTYAFQKPAPDVFRTMMGASVKEAIRRAIDSGADVIGANCGAQLALDDYVSLAHQIIAIVGNMPVIIQPNAGAPRTEGEQIRYAAAPAQMKATALGLVAAGVKIVGGCCGTTPEHVAAICQALKSSNHGTGQSS